MSDILKDVEKKMTLAVDHLKKEYQALRTNRVNPQMLDDVKVEVYGSMTPIKSLGSITVQERNLIVTPFDPSTATAIVKGIQTSPLKLNPIQDKSVIRVPVPPLNEELRKDIAKQAKQKMEQSKTAVRDIRKQGNDTVREEKKNGTITEDMMKGLEKKIQELTDKYCKVLDETYVVKEKEILTV
ncbi:MAG: ribosome recycling factor [Chlamydiae bacterium]|jgi:ribosome recycling factor|nr:ribosome recycling factor [Chlamydiota bacterium]